MLQILGKISCEYRR